MTPNEHQIEVSILELLNAYSYICWKNYDQAAFRDGAYRKNKWQRRGISDITVLLKNGRTLWLEVKKPGCVQSQGQKDFEADVRAHNGFYAIVYGAKEAFALVKDLERF